MKDVIFPLLCALALATWLVAIRTRDPVEVYVPPPLTFDDAVDTVDAHGDLIPPELAPGLAERGEYHLVGDVDDLPLEVEWIAHYDDWTLEQIEAELERLQGRDGPWLAVYLPAIQEKQWERVQNRPEAHVDGVLYAPTSSGDYIVVREIDVEGGFVELERLRWLNDRARHLRANARSAAAGGSRPRGQGGG